jgi:hypothetical protein
MMTDAPGADGLGEPGCGGWRADRAHDVYLLGQKGPR